jgi:hypothetical protein
MYFEKSGHMARFFARLVGGVFLRARVFQDVAERSRQCECALLAVQDRGELPARRLRSEPDLLPPRHSITDPGAEDDEKIVGQDHFGIEIERFAEIDVLPVQRIPKMVMGGGDDFVEGGRASAIALHLQHGGKVARVGGIVRRIFRDLAHEQTSRTATRTRCDA